MLLLSSAYVCGLSIKPVNDVFYDADTLDLSVNNEAFWQYVEGRAGIQQQESSVAGGTGPSIRAPVKFGHRVDRKSYGLSQASLQLQPQ